MNISRSVFISIFTIKRDTPTPIQLKLNLNSIHVPHNMATLTFYCCLAICVKERATGCLVKSPPLYNVSIF